MRTVTFGRNSTTNLTYGYIFMPDIADPTASHEKHFAGLTRNSKSGGPFNRLPLREPQDDSDALCQELRLSSTNVQTMLYRARMRLCTCP
jgi:hypothetical protein